MLPLLRFYGDFLVILNKGFPNLKSKNLKSFILIKNCDNIFGEVGVLRYFEKLAQKSKSFILSIDYHGICEKECFVGLFMITAIFKDYGNFLFLSPWTSFLNF